MTGLIGIALWALIPGFIAKNKGRSFFGYFFLSFLISPLITMIITICLSNLNEDVSEINEWKFYEGDYNTQWSDIQHSVPQMVKDRCKEFAGDVNRIENYLNNCAKESLIKRNTIPAIIKHFASPEQFEHWRALKESHHGNRATQQNDSIDSVQKKVTLAHKLAGSAPNEILQHCDSISHKRVLLETYLMQCKNQGKISQETATMLLEQYSHHMDKSAAGQASCEKLAEKTKQEAKATGLSLYSYVKNQLPESARNTIEEKKDDLESLERYLRVCVDQKLLNEYYFEVILEEEKGNCALRRLQATGGQHWEPHGILRGLVPENILNHCDKDAGSYSRQIVYLDQQVVQKNITRQTADLILNIYKLARER